MSPNLGGGPSAVSMWAAVPGRSRRSCAGEGITPGSLVKARLRSEGPGQVLWLDPGPLWLRREQRVRQRDPPEGPRSGWSGAQRAGQAARTPFCPFRQQPKARWELAWLPTPDTVAGAASGPDCNHRKPPKPAEYDGPANPASAAHCNHRKPPKPAEYDGPAKPVAGPHCNHRKPPKPAEYDGPANPAAGPHCNHRKPPKPAEYDGPGNPAAGPHCNHRKARGSEGRGASRVES